MYDDNSYTYDWELASNEQPAADLRYQTPGFKRLETLTVDGAVPDVVHSLEYIGKNNLTVASRQSVKAFKHIPDLHILEEGKDGAPDYEPPERPVLEIVTKVFSPLAIPKGQNTSRRGRGWPSSVSRRPITAAFAFPNSSQWPGSSAPAPSANEGNGTQVHEPFMNIWSEELKNAIKANVAYYPDIKLCGSPLVISSPYRVLYHHRKELAFYRDRQPKTHTAEYAERTKKHINVLLDFLEQNQSAEMQKEADRHQLETPTATFENFWMLLKPGEIIFSKRYGIWAPFIISRVTGGKDAGSSTEPYRITAWFLEYDGVKVERFMHFFTVAPWLGDQVISTLPVVPGPIWKDDFEGQKGMPMWDKFVEEGQLYWDLLKSPRYMEYTGQLVKTEHDYGQISGPSGFLSGRVICDPTGFAQFADQAASLEDQSRTERRSFRAPPPGLPVSPPKDHLPKTIPLCGCKSCSEERSVKGYNYDSMWVGHEDVDLECLKPVVTDKAAFKSLVIEESLKLTVKTLIGRFAATSLGGNVSEWGKDFIKNKGQGRIFLLHGKPGVGKTCTPECMAELSGRPLLPLTSGDLGVQSNQVEPNLNYFLELGQRYGALVLLDEADVYLERRNRSDMDRNALVSIFLRALEYYSGCIIISTNRVESFDPAFMSRIHVALHYKNLRDEDRERIWNNHFDRLDRDSGGQVYISPATRHYILTSEDVRRLKWNGREIRNAIQTAVGLAESEAEEEGVKNVTISEKHMQSVVNLSRSFKEYLAESAER